MTLRLTTQETLDPTARLKISTETIAPTSLQRELFDPSQHDLAGALIDALRDFAVDHTPGQFRTRLTDEHSVTALGGAYAHLASQAVMGSPLAHRLIEVTRHLGGQTSLDIRSSLEDIRCGPIAIFAAASDTPMVVLELDDSFFACKSTQRTRFLRHLPRLTPGVDIRLTGSYRILRKLLERHGGDLPASVTEDAQSRLLQTPSTLTEQTDRDAEDALADLGLDHPAWPLVESIAHTSSERRAYPDLYADPSFSVSDDGIRQRLKRLRDVDIVESMPINGTTYASLTPVGAAAVEQHPRLETDHSRDSRQADAPSDGGSWDTEHTDQPEPQASGPTQSTVTDPRTDQSSTVLPQHAWEGVDSRGASAAEEEISTDSSLSCSDCSMPSTQFLQLHEHHAIASAASHGHFALIHRVVNNSDLDRDRRESRYSHDESRDEIVVSVDFSPTIALTAVRLCTALLSDPAFEQVLTPDRLAGQPGGHSLDGLDISNPYVLRGAVCVGWLRDVDADATGFRDRLMQARRTLLAKTGDLYDSDGTLNEDQASEILQEAHGLMGTALRLYDLLGVDVVREIQFPNGAPDDPELQKALRKFVAMATSIGSRYGAYSSHRVLHEDRPVKRDQLISKPAVDPADPDGTLLGSWVFSGENTSSLRSTLETGPEDLSIQDDGEKFASFRLPGRIVDGNRRTAIGEAVTRLLTFKDGLRPDRQAISVLTALTNDIVSASEAIVALGSEDETRPLDMQDIQYGLSQLSWQQVVPELGGDVVSKVIHTLVDAQEPLSTADVADRAGCSTRGMAAEDNDRVFSELEAAGLLERTDLGAGKPTEWRLCLPFRQERCDSDPPLPTMLVDRETAFGGVEWRLSDGVFEVFVTAAEEHGISYEFNFGSGPFLEAIAGPPSERDISPFLSAYPAHSSTIELLAALLDVEDRLSIGQAETVIFGQDPRPNQSSLEAVIA